MKSLTTFPFLRSTTPGVLNMTGNHIFEVFVPEMANNHPAHVHRGLPAQTMLARSAKAGGDS